MAPLQADYGDHQSGTDWKGVYEERDGKKVRLSQDYVDRQQNFHREMYSDMGIIEMVLEGLLFPPFLRS